MKTHVVVIRSRRLARTLRVQAVQHGVAGLALVVGGLEGLSSRGEHALPLLPSLEVFAGLVLAVAVVRELRAARRGANEGQTESGGHFESRGEGRGKGRSEGEGAGDGKGHGEGAVNPVDLFAGLALITEGLVLAHEGRHRIQYGYYLAGALLAARGFLHQRLRGIRRLRIDEAGILLRSSPWRKLHVSWKEVAGADVTERAVHLSLTDGTSRRIDLKDMENAAEVRRAVEGAFRERPSLPLLVAGERPASGRPKLLALTREVSSSLDRCELTHRDRAAIDVEVARRQHAEYEDRLRELGCEVRRLEEEGDYPDSVFIEDTAVVLDPLAVITRPGAESRRGETDAVAGVLAAYREVWRLSPPATLDGGDVLVLDSEILVGRSGRTNAAGVAQMRRFVEPHGYAVREVPVSGCLHLKSAVTRVGEDLLLVNPAWIDPEVLRSLRRPFRIIEVDPTEPDAANGLLVNGSVVFPRAFPRTRARLESAGVSVVPVDVSELAKAEGAVTCCSLVFAVR